MVGEAPLTVALLCIVADAGLGYNLCCKFTSLAKMRLAPSGKNAESSSSSLKSSLKNIETIYKTTITNTDHKNLYENR